MARVRFWAGARALTGTSETVVDRATLGAVLAEVRESYVDLGPLLAVSVVLVDGAQVEADTDLALDGECLVEILPPYAGG